MRINQFLFFVFFIAFLSPYRSTAQDINLIGRGSVGIGFDYLSQDFKGIKTFYSPGGGVSFEAGMEGELQNDIFWYGTVGITFNLNLHYEEVNGVTQKTSYSWNKKFFTAGATKYFDIRNNFIDNFYGGGGLTFGIPGILRRTENDDYKGRIRYNPALGFQLEGGATLSFSDVLLLRPSIRYRFIRYNSKSYAHGDVKSLEPSLRKARGEGIDISVSIVRTIKSGRR